MRVKVVGMETLLKAHHKHAVPLRAGRAVQDKWCALGKPRGGLKRGEVEDALAEVNLRWTQISDYTSDTFRVPVQQVLAAMDNLNLYKPGETWSQFQWIKKPTAPEPAIS